MDLILPKPLKIGETIIEPLNEFKGIEIDRNRVALVQMCQVRTRNKPQKGSYYSESSHWDIYKIIAIYPTKKAYNESGYKYGIDKCCWKDKLLKQFNLRGITS